MVGLAATHGRSGPYQGLIPYGEDDADWFFGRDRARAVVLDNLRAYQLSVIYGPSGVGKSSLLRAGVVRHVREAGRRRMLRGGPAEYAAVAFGTWSGDPTADLIAAIGDALDRLSPELGTTLPDGPLADVVVAAARRLDGALLLILDQFEEYFLYHDADGPFIAQLAGIVARRDVPVSVLFSIREDALAKLDPLTGHLPGLLDHLVRLGRLDRAAAREAVVRPIERWNGEAAGVDDIRIEPELVEATLDAVQGSSLGGGELDGIARGPSRTSDAGVQTPYLQLVLTRLWDEERSRGSRVLRLSTLRQLHGVERIVAEHVDTAIATLSLAEQAVAAKILRQLVTPSGTKIALTSSDLAETAELEGASVTAVLERLTREGRILQATGNGRYEIYHDALARPVLAWRRRWQAAQERAAQRRRIQIVAAIACGVLLTVVVVVVLAWQAVERRREADRSTAQKRSVALAFAAGDQLRDQPDVSLLLALAALEQRDLPEARNSMMAAREAASRGDAIGIMRGHADEVNGVAFVRGGRAIASTADAGRGLLWDAATRRRIGMLPSSPRATFTSLASSRDGSTLAAGSATGAITVWDVAASAAKRLTGTTKSVNAVALSPDGRLLASGGEERVIRLWDVRSGRQHRPAIAVGNRRTLDLAFSPDGTTLASADSTYAVRLWSVRSRRQRGETFERADTPLTRVAFAPDGRTLAVGGAGTWLWTPASGRVRRVGGAGQVNDVAFSPNGKRLAAAGNDRTVRIWGAPFGSRQRPPLAGPAARVDTVAFSPDGQRVAAAGADRRVWLFDVATTPVLDRHTDTVNDIAFHAGGGVLVSAGADAKVWRWNVRSRRALAPPLAGTSGFFKIALGRDDRTLAATNENGELELWRGQAPGAQRRQLLSAEQEVVNGVALSPDGRTLASGGDEDPEVVLRDVAGRPGVRARLGAHTRRVTDVAFSPDGRTLASGGADRRVRLWDVKAGRELAALPLRHEEEINDVAFSGDGNTLASAGSDGRIWLWDVAARQPLVALVARSPVVLSVAFAPDGRTLIAGGTDGSIALWDVASRRPLGTRIPAHEGSVNAIAVSPDGLTLASGGADATARLWTHLLWHSLPRLRTEICDLVGAGLTPQEWEHYATGIPHMSLCEK